MSGARRPVARRTAPVDVDALRRYDRAIPARQRDRRREVGEGYDEERVASVYGKWNERVDPIAPKGATPISTLTT